MGAEGTNGKTRKVLLPEGIKNVHLPPTQVRMLTLLSDGEAHTFDELIACLSDSEQGDIIAVRLALSRMRKHLLKFGHDIVSRGKTYRQMKSLHDTPAVHPTEKK